MIQTPCWLRPAAEDKKVVVAREVAAVIRVEVAPAAQIRVEVMRAVVSVVAGRFTHRQ
jgi:hypothetical protein